MWRLSALFLTLSVLVTFWIAHEVGLMGSRVSMAGEPVVDSEGKGKEAGGIASLQKSLDVKSKQLVSKDEELSRREKQIAEKESLLGQQILRYERIIADLKMKVSDLEAQQGGRSESFRQIYEKMEPKKSAKILDEMDVHSAAQILENLNPSRAAEIMAKMGPEKARHITERLLSKRKLASQGEATKVSEKGQ